MHRETEKERIDVDNCCCQIKGRSQNWGNGNSNEHTHTASFHLHKAISDGGGGEKHTLSCGCDHIVRSARKEKWESVKSKDRKMTAAEINVMICA